MFIFILLFSDILHREVTPLISPISLGVFRREMILRKHSLLRGKLFLCIFMGCSRTMKPSLPHLILLILRSRKVLLLHL